MTILCILLGSRLHSDQLWETAVRVFESNSAWIPGEMFIFTEEYDSGGKLKSAETMRLVYVPRPAGSENGGEYEIIEATKDGSDVTEERRREAEKRRSPSGPPEGAGDTNPFDPSLRDRVTYAAAGTSAVIGGVPCRGYSFKLDGKKRFAYKGTAWIDPATGMPLLIELEFDRLPPLVTEFRMLTRYNSDPAAWYPVEIEMDAAGTILLASRAYHTRMLFSRYLRPR